MGAGARAAHELLLANWVFGTRRWPRHPVGRDKSGPYALAIASLGSPRQFATSILKGETRWKGVGAQFIAP